MNRVTKAVGNGMSVVLAIIVFSMAYWIFIPVTPVVHSNIQVLTPTVHAGNDLLVSMDVVKNIVSPAIISRTMLDCNSHLAYSLNYEGGALPKGSFNLILAIHIPLYVLPGRYKITTISSYDVNPLRTETIEYIIPCFEVIP